MTKQLRKKILNAFIDDINKAFSELKIDDKVRAFKELENWATNTNEIDDDGRALFIKALYTSDATKDARVIISVEDGIKRIRGAI